MKVLHVEDDPEWAERVVASRLRDKQIEVDVVSSVEDAKQALSNEGFDYVLLDLSIPSSDSVSSPDIGHGIELCTYIREEYPGIPILVLTGQSTEEAAEEREDQETLEIFWSGELKKLLKIRQKRKTDEAIDLVISAAADLNNLENIEITASDCGLDNIEKRILRVFAKYRNANSVDVRKIQGGLTSSSTYRIKLLDLNQQTIISALAKIGSWEKVNQDQKNIPETQRLAIGSTPQLICSCFAGCGKYKGLFLQLAENQQQSYFDALKRSDDDSCTIVSNLKDILVSWHVQREAKSQTIREIRQALCPDEKLGPGLTIEDLTEFEEKRVTTWNSTTHGDLHGLNVLVDDDMKPVLIDFGNISQLPSCIDAITLELSPYFHPYLEDDFELSDNIVDAWLETDRWIEVSPNPKTTRELRSWIGECKHGNREYLAVTYAYLINQLRYDSKNHESALKLVRKIIEVFE